MLPLRCHDFFFPFSPRGALYAIDARFHYVMRHEMPPPCFFTYMLLMVLLRLILMPLSCHFVAIRALDALR